MPRADDPGSGGGAVRPVHLRHLDPGGAELAPGAAGSAATFNGNVPNHATNADGSGSPGGTHASPGDSGYTAIWSGNSP